MASQVVRLNANLQPEAALALDDLANRIGGNRTTALHQAILLADLLYREADDHGTIQVKKAGSAPRTVDLPKINPELARRFLVDMVAIAKAPAAPTGEEGGAPAQAADSADTAIAKGADTAIAKGVAPAAPTGEEGGAPAEAADSADTAIPGPDQE